MQRIPEPTSPVGYNSRKGEKFRFIRVGLPSQDHDHRSFRDLIVKFLKVVQVHHNAAPGKMTRAAIVPLFDPAVKTDAPAELRDFDCGEMKFRTAIEHLTSEATPSVILHASLSSRLRRLPFLVPPSAARQERSMCIPTARSRSDAPRTSTPRTCGAPPVGRNSDISVGEGCFPLWLISERKY